MTNDLDHDGLLAQQRLHPEWTWNRSDSHVFLGVPGSPDTFKTVIEPGNSFSPGFRSYGVSTWVSVDSRLYTPEELDVDELSWRYARGFLPILGCSWAAGPLKVSSALFTDGEVGSRNVRTFLSCSVENCSALHVDAVLYIAIRSFGPAGGPISELEFDGRDVLVNGAVVLTFESTPDLCCAIGYGETGKDISVVLRDGHPARHEKATDESGWASGAAGFIFNLGAGGRTTTNLTAFVHSGDPMLNWLRRRRGLPPEVGDAALHEKLWAERLPVALDLPDPRFVEAFQAQLVYMAITTVGCEPRICPVSYPLWWLRDGAYVIQALAKGGFMEWVERAVRAVASREPFGGFGAEGDGASQLIWLLSEHYLMSGDLGFLKDVYPHVERNAELLLRMRRSDRPIFGATESRTPQMLLSPQADLICAPACDGLIVGRMDNHFPLFWVNGWAYFALTRAALCADAARCQC